MTDRLIDSLITTGAAQVSPTYAPDNYAALFELANDTDGWGHGTLGWYELCKIYPQFSVIVQSVLQLTGYENKLYPLTATKNESAHPNIYWHRDFEKLGEYPGFSLLLSEAKQAGRNQLLTAGRLPQRSMTEVETFEYAQGPVLIAQDGFSRNNTPPHTPLGRTWHTGSRNVPASFFAIDIRVPNHNAENS